MKAEALPQSLRQDRRACSWAPLAGLIAELIALVAPVEIPHVALLVGRIHVDRAITSLNASGAAAVVVLEGQLSEPSRLRVDDDAPVGTQSALQRYVVRAEQGLARDPRVSTPTALRGADR